MIGKLNLEEQRAELQVRFVPPKNLSVISLLLTKPVPDSAVSSRNPDFPLSVRVRVAEPGGDTIIDDLITNDRMQWTNWHEDPSLLLKIGGWLGDRLNSEREYDLTISMESPVAELGEAEVFLHWIDQGYVWGRDEQKLKLTTRSGETLPR